MFEKKCKITRFFGFEPTTGAIMLTFQSHNYYVISFYSRSLPYLISWSGVILETLSVTQQSVHNLLKPNFHYSVHIRIPPVRILSYINSCHTIRRDFPNIHNMIIKYKCMFSKYSLHQIFPPNLIAPLP